MVVNVDISEESVVVENESISFEYNLKSNTYTITTPFGSLNKVLHTILVSDADRLQKYYKENIYQKINKTTLKKLGKLFHFIPITSDIPIDTQISVQDVNDKIGIGKLIKIPQIYVSPVMFGRFLGNLCITMYENRENAIGELILWVELVKWSDFSAPPKIHSIAPLFAYNESKWELFEGKSPLSTNITFFRNGYQSWTKTELLNFDQKAIDTPTDIGKFNLQNQDHSIKTRYCSEMVSALTDTQTMSSIVLGFITNENNFNRILMDRLEFDGTFRILIAISQFDNIQIDSIKPKPVSSEKLMVAFSPPNKGHLTLKHWASLTGLTMNSKILDLNTSNAQDVKLNSNEKVLSGWCSWYYYYTKISESEMIKNIKFLSDHKEFPIDIIQLDDGYQTCVGDFTSINEKFPSGMKALVDKIHGAGYIAGLWIAPFYAQDKSQIVKEHPKWFLKNKKGKSLKIGWNWGSFLYGYDLTNPDAVNHIKSLVTTIIRDWGFDFIKIDFIFASEAIKGIYSDSTVTRAQALRRGVQTIRDAMGNAILLGCGAPLGPCIGLVDIMRIGTDTAATWKMFGKLTDIAHHFNLEIPCLRNALLATVERSFMHNALWFNDPDCVVVRENKSKLKLHEVQLQLTIFGLSGGQVFFSDDLSLLPEDRLYYMNLLIPPFKQGALAIDMLKNYPPRLFAMKVDAAVGNRILLAVINWEDSVESEIIKIEDIIDLLGAENIETDRFLLYDFWNTDNFPFKEVHRKERIQIYSIHPHSCKYYSIIPIDDNKTGIKMDCPLFISSNLHITQGCAEVSKFVYDNGRKLLTIEFNIKGMRSGEITILVPDHLELQQGAPEGTEVQDTDLGKWITIPVTLPQNNHLELSFK